MRYDRGVRCFAAALEARLSGLKNIALHLALTGALIAWGPMQARAQWGLFQSQAPAPNPQGQAQQGQAQAAPPPQGTARGENFSAKPAPQLFASDCTGSGCHRGPQGLAKDRGQSSLASFLREHYTNSRESAAALAAYLVSVPGDARAARPERPAADKPPRAAAKPDEAAKPAERRPAADAAAKPPRGRQTTAAKPEVAPEPPAPEPVPVAPAPPPEPPKPQWDIFD